jgi:hypothetical protein
MLWPRRRGATEVRRRLLADPRPKDRRPADGPADRAEGLAAPSPEREVVLLHDDLPVREDEVCADAVDDTTPGCGERIPCLTRRPAALIVGNSVTADDGQIDGLGADQLPHGADRPRANDGREDRVVELRAGCVQRLHRHGVMRAQRAIEVAQELLIPVHRRSPRRWHPYRCSEISPPVARMRPRCHRGAAKILLPSLRSHAPDSAVPFRW